MYKITDFVASALALETSLKQNLEQFGAKFTVSAPAIRTNQSGTSIISISLSNQTGEQTRPVPENIATFRAFLQQFFQANASVSDYVFKDVDIIQIILIADNVITKWQLIVTPKAQDSELEAC